MRSQGLLDIQVNGFAGVDFNDAALTPEALDHALEAMLATGVTACLPTIITAHPHELAERFAALDAAVARSRLGPAMALGYHLEGPFLNPADGYKGCHPAAAMTPPDPTLVQSLQASLSRPILLVTVAPERDPDNAFTRWACDAGIVVAIGHSNATAAEVAQAAEAGATLSTHLGNGVAHQQHKFDNPIVAQLAEDRLWADFIADGVHLAPAALKVMLRAKGLERSILVTDAVAAAASPPGLYPFAGMTVEKTADGRVSQPGTPYLAGSCLTLDGAVRNVVRWGLATPEQAVAMASTHPRTLLAPAMRRHGVVEPPSEVTWSPTLAVDEVRLNGSVVVGG
ncbi:N-acetylglucosamine-6-phosphate deacetylase [Alsobacter metallidurans]|uniref:N-acetylglucosamine-6-phosphate deacetylase n=1 Tax=Alsobacter metallidurans TaxID=340221 RepID=A0A917I7H3_9HYPH|nr:amidohydrolase family protein [Alsobacter metallidurans]GGH19279.1 N-acetylglucosamine-6-phosphate deacetylase [Alsobacter metallidurans]